MKPIGKYVFVKDVKEESKGLIVTSNEDKTKRAVVSFIGTDIEHLSEGDEIYYEKFRGFTMRVNGELYTIIREQDVIVILD